MNFCSRCGNKLNNNEVRCINCGMNVKNDMNPVVNLDISNIDVIEEKAELSEKKSKTPFVLALISLILALIPILLFVYCVIISEMSNDPSNGSGWLLVIYYWTIGIPNSIIALILGIISYVKQKNKLAICSIIIDILPYLYFIYILTFHS